MTIFMISLAVDSKKPKNYTNLNRIIKKINDKTLTNVSNDLEKEVSVAKSDIVEFPESLGMPS